MVSTAALLGMVFSCIVSLILPIAALIIVRFKMGKGLFACLVGAGCFFVFALVLEQLLHGIVIPRIQESPWLFVLYGCLAAGLFEETGRLVGLRFLCVWRRKKDASLATGIGYGIGHGGIEAVLVVGLSVLSTLLFSVQLNAGGPDALLATAGVQAGLVQQQIVQLQTMPAYLFYIAGIERLSAMALHMALSILMWMVVTKRLSLIFYPVAIVLHALTNVAAAAYQIGAIHNVFLVEVCVGVAAGMICLLVWFLYRRTSVAIAEHTT